MVLLCLIPTGVVVVFSWTAADAEAAGGLLQQPSVYIYSNSSSIFHAGSLSKATSLSNSHSLLID
jgi:hypothetical protein